MNEIPPPIDLDLLIDKADAVLASMPPDAVLIMERTAENLAAPFHLNTPAEMRAFALGLLAAWNIHELPDHQETVDHARRQSSLSLWAASCVRLSRGR